MKSYPHFGEEKKAKLIETLFIFSLKFYEACTHTRAARSQSEMADKMGFRVEIEKCGTALCALCAKRNIKM